MALNTITVTLTVSIIFATYSPQVVSSLYYIVWLLIGRDGERKKEKRRRRKEKERRRGSKEVVSLNILVWVVCIFKDTLYYITV